MIFMTMKKQNAIFVIFGGLLLLSAYCLSASAETETPREYKIKAAFLYNFIKTAEWPKETMDRDSEKITIGIIGKNPFGDAFGPIENQIVKDRILVIKYFSGFSERQKNKAGKPDLSDYDLASLRQCHALFICSSEVHFFRDILKVVENGHVLTVSEVDGFVENGGIINFIPGASKGEFEVNLITLEKAELTISSKILRIAKRVISAEK